MKADLEIGLNVKMKGQKVNNVMKSLEQLGNWALKKNKDFQRVD